MNLAIEQLLSRANNAQANMQAAAMRAAQAAANAAKSQGQQGGQQGQQGAQGAQGQQGAQGAQGAQQCGQAQQQQRQGPTVDPTNAGAQNQQAGQRWQQFAQRPDELGANKMKDKCACPGQGNELNDEQRAALYDKLTKQPASANAANPATAAGPADPSACARPDAGRAQPAQAGAQNDNGAAQQPQQPRARRGAAARRSGRSRRKGQKKAKRRGQRQPQRAQRRAAQCPRPPQRTEQPRPVTGETPRTAEQPRTGADAPRTAERRRTGEDAPRTVDQSRPGADAPRTPAGRPQGVPPSSNDLRPGPMGQQLGDAAERVARRMNRTGRCAEGVNNALNSLGVGGRGHAYQKAEQLAKDSRFREVNVSRDQLKNLPRGAVVVWGKSGEKPYGHVSVALGNGREASDHIQNQMTGGRYGTNFGNGPDPQGRQYRVFIPK